MHSTARGVRTALVLIAATALLGGCSDANLANESPALGTPTSREALATDVAEWLCDGFASCCSTAGIDFDRGACLETQRAKRLRNWASEEERSRRRFSESEAAECVELLATTPPSCGSRLHYRECISGVLDGMLEIGEPCEFKSECKGQRQGRVSCRNGVCTERGVAGDDCRDPSCGPDDTHCFGSCDLCGRGTVCRADESGSHRCTPFSKSIAAEGESCAETPGASGGMVPVGTDLIEAVQCDRDLYCGPNDICIPRGGPGDECDTLVRCDRGLVCIGGICESTETAGPGDPCENDSDCAYTAGQYCHRLEGRCAEPAGAGELCGSDAQIDARCATGLVCPSHRFDPDQRRCMTSQLYNCSLLAGG